MKSENWPLDLTACNSSTRVSLLHGFVAKAWLGLRENEWKRGFKLNLKQDQRHIVEESHTQFWDHVQNAMGAEIFLVGSR